MAVVVHRARNGYHRASYNAGIALTIKLYIMAPYVVTTQEISKKTKQ